MRRLPPRLEAMRVEGTLSETDFLDLVQELHKAHWTGLLTLTRQGVGRSVTVQDGRLVFASSSSPDDRLGELLLRRGRITLRQLVDAGKAVAPGKRLGTILVELGILEPKELVKAVVDHTQEIIYGVFQWTEGRYRLQEGQVPAEAITLNIRTPELIRDGIRRIDAWSRIDRGVGGLTARYEAGPEAKAVLSQLTGLSADERAFLEGFAEPRDIETACRESKLGDFEACRLAWAFRVMGALQRIDPPPPPATAMDDEGLDLVLKGD
jgi:hypothetical protein